MHGPLNLISILDLWRDVRAGKASGELGSGDWGESGLDSVYPEKIAYRATSPLYAEDEYRIVLDERNRSEDGKRSAVEIITPDGNVGMKADITDV